MTPPVRTPQHIQQAPTNNQRGQLSQLTPVRCRRCGRWLFEHTRIQQGIGPRCAYLEAAAKYGFD